MPVNRKLTNATQVSEPVDRERSPRVTIVGGGTAGWMTAATFRRRLGWDVTLIESAQTAGVGVGEATIPSMTQWLENMQIDEAEFLRRCGGTYKLAIRFEGWINGKDSYWHPFGTTGVRVGGQDLAEFLPHAQQRGWLDTNAALTQFNVQTQLAEGMHSPAPIGGSPVLEHYGYHLDARRLSHFLQELAIGEGVRHRIGHVCQVHRDRRGQILELHLADGTTDSADLFVDCSGFAGALIKEAENSDWQSASDTLLCDRAVTMQVKHSGSINAGFAKDTGFLNNTGFSKETGIAPYTISRAMSSGWSWQIPLADRVGFGYVYSSRHIADENAVDELREQVDQRVNQQLDGTSQGGRSLAASESFRVSHPTIIPMRIGHRPRSYSANCLAIGLSAGFIEPLESTGIHLVIQALDDWIECGCDQQSLTADSESRNHFNQRTDAAYREVRDFVALHYVLSERNDTSFWRDATSVPLPSSLASEMKYYLRHGRPNPTGNHHVFAHANHHFIWSGKRAASATSFQRNRESVPMRELAIDQVNESLSAIRRQHLSLASSMPSHHSYLQSLQSPFIVEPNESISS